MGDHLRYGSSGHLVANSTTGHLVNDSCLPPCTGSPLACPSGTAASYTVGLPSSVSFTGCSTNPTACSPSISSVTVSGSCAANWKTPGGTGYCVAGINAKNTGLGSSSVITLLNTNDTLGCPCWEVTIAFGNAGLTTDGGTVIYRKLRTGATINDVVGTYDLHRITNRSGTTCGAGTATADATITVSP